MLGETAVVLCATTVLAAGLQAWDDTGLHRPLTRTSVVVAVIVVVLGALHSWPLPLALPLELRLGVRWRFAVAYGVARKEPDDVTREDPERHSPPR